MSGIRDLLSEIWLKSASERFRMVGRSCEGLRKPYFGLGNVRPGWFRAVSEGCGRLRWFRKPNFRNRGITPHHSVKRSPRAVAGGRGGFLGFSETIFTTVQFTSQSEEICSEWLRAVWECSGWFLTVSAVAKVKSQEYRNYFPRGGEKCFRMDAGGCGELRGVVEILFRDG